MAISVNGEIAPTPSAQLRSVPSDRVSYVLIGEDADGQRLDNFLFRIAKGVPKGHVYRVIRAGEVRVSKKRAKAETKLSAGDVVRIPPMRVAQKPASAPQAAPLAEGTLPVLYEDRHLLIVLKPAGIAAHGGSGISHGLIERLRATRPEEPMLELCHRLDKETSGAIVIAKTRKALVRMHDLMKEGGVEKHYKLLVKGDWVNERQHVKVPLERYLLPSGERRVRVSQDGMSAHTIFTVLERFGEVTYLDAELKTGRTHQIRVHMAHITHPLVGDPVYGGRPRPPKGASEAFISTLRKFDRQALHATMLRLYHPISGIEMEWHAPIPQDMVELIEVMRADFEEHKDEVDWL